jgi:glycolate oxidase FAD binding subunit
VKTPGTHEELAEALHRTSLHLRTIELHGCGSKCLMAGPRHPADESFSTAALNRVLEYEPGDLTISVEAGLPWRELTRTLAANRQMVPLDPPFSDCATVGGVVAANCSGARRRLYGTARDFVIGMRFATLQGKLVQSGGMVVKNVAGLDMAKLLIGSFGTLAAIVVVNFKVQPMPEVERTLLLAFDSADAAIAARDRLLATVLQPSAVELLNPSAGAIVGYPNWMLAVRAGGNAAAVDRHERELEAFGDWMALESEPQRQFWEYVEEFTPRFLAGHPDGAVVRVSCTLKELHAVMASFDGPALARAGSGICYGYFDDAGAAAAWLAASAHHGWKAVMDFAPEDRKASLDLWPAPGMDLEMMRRVKRLFDPDNVLNRGRLYSRI